MKQLARAQAMLEEILEAHPRFPGAQFNLGVLYEEQRRPEEARAAYAAEVANYPEQLQGALQSREGARAALGDWPGSIEQMREVVRIAPKRPEGYLFLARALLHESAPLDEVQTLAEKGLALAEDSGAQGARVVPDGRRVQPQTSAGQGDDGVEKRAGAGVPDARSFRCEALTAQISHLGPVRAASRARHV